MDQNRRRELLQKYINRQLSSAELKEFLDGIGKAEYDDLPDMEEIAVRYHEEAGADLPEKILEADRKARTRFRTLRYLTASAAAVLLLIGVAGWYKYYAGQQRAPSFRTVSVPFGTMHRLVLEDSTVVTLTSGSVFRYPEAFHNKERRVYLDEGKAFFQVTRSMEEPFTVQSGKLETTALGTSFTVQRSAHYNFEKVNLYTGKVGVNLQGGKEDRQILLPGEQLTHENNNGTGEKAAFNSTGDPLNGGRLVFRETPFHEALYSIASHYGVNLQFDKASFSGKLLTADFNSQDVNEVLRALTFIHHLNINRIDNKNYTLMPGKNEP